MATILINIDGRQKATFSKSELGALGCEISYTNLLL